MKKQTNTLLSVINSVYSISGLYMLASQKNSPPLLKFFPVFVDFLRSFKLHKGILKGLPLEK